MTSKERVLLAFEHKESDRVPLWYGASEELTKKLLLKTGSVNEEVLMQKLHIDFRRVFQEYTGPELPTLEDGRFINYWGIERGGIEYGQPLSHPAAASYFG